MESFIIRLIINHLIHDSFKKEQVLDNLVLNPGDPKIIGNSWTLSWPRSWKIDDVCLMDELRHDLSVHTLNVILVDSYGLYFTPVSFLFLFIFMNPYVNIFSSRKWVSVP